MEQIADHVENISDKVSVIEQRIEDLQQIVARDDPAWRGAVLRQLTHAKWILVALLATLLWRLL